MSAPPAKKAKQNDGKANPQQPQQKQQQGKKQQQQGGKPQQQSQKPKQQPQAKKEKQQQPQQQQQSAADGQKLSKNQKKKLKKQQAAGNGDATPAAAKPAAPAKKQDKQDKKQAQEKKQPDSKKRPLEQKQEPQDDDDDNDDDQEDDGFDISDQCLEAMADIQGKLDAVERKGAKQMALIEKKMAAERHPFYVERATQLRTIPHVWREIFTSVDVFSNELQENDIEILEFLENVFITDHADEGFETDFEFASNPIFSNKKLSINLKFPPPSDDDEDEEDDDQEATATVTPVEWKDASYPEKHPNSWFVRFFTQNFIDDYDNQQTLQFLRDHVWPSPLEALSGALNNPDDDDDDMDPMMIEGSDDDDGDAPDLVPADDDDE